MEKLTEKKLPKFSRYWFAFPSMALYKINHKLFSILLAIFELLIIFIPCIILFYQQNEKNQYTDSQIILTIATLFYITNIIVWFLIFRISRIKWNEQGINELIEKDKKERRKYALLWIIIPILGTPIIMECIFILLFFINIFIIGWIGALFDL